MFGYRVMDILVLLALISQSFHVSQAKPEPRGGKRAFGMGLLGGALAGGLIGHAVAKPRAPTQTRSEEAHSKPLTVIETTAKDANGCYKQIIKETVPGNSKAYTETVHLVCPSNHAAPNAVHAAVVPIPVAPAVHPAAVVQPAVTAANHSHTVVTSNATHTHVVVDGAKVAPSQAVPAHVVNFPHTQPQPQPQTPHVVIVSKQTKYYSKKKSGASSIYVPQSVLAMMVIFYGFKALLT